jgi:phospholipase/carboxylesterase
LADFVAAAALAYGFDARRVFVAGYSNGANIAAGTLMLRPQTLAGAVLLRPMVPLIPDPLPKLAGIPVLIGAGEIDPIVPPNQTRALADLLTQCGVIVEVFSQRVGHQITQDDIETARDWLSKNARR